MEAALGDFEALILALSLHPVDQPIILGNPARPPALEAALQGLRLSNPLERCPPAFPDDVVQPLEGLGVRAVPVEIIVPGAIGPQELHAAASRSVTSSRSVPPPFSS